MRYFRTYTKSQQYQTVDTVFLLYTLSYFLSYRIIVAETSTVSLLLTILITSTQNVIKV